MSAAPTQPTSPTSFDNALDAFSYEVSLAQYGQKMHAWSDQTQANLRYEGRRLEVGLATEETRQAFSELVFPLMFHQDAAYRPAALNSDLNERIVHAAASVIMTRSDNGRLVPNYSKLGGTIIAAYLGKSIYANALQAPELDSAGFPIRYIGYSLVGDMGTNITHELVRSALDPDLTMYQLHGASTNDSYYPLSLGGKAVAWMRGTYSIRNIAAAVLIGGLPQYKSIPIFPSGSTLARQELYGRDIQVWRRTLEESARYHGRRFIGGLAESESQMLLQNLIVPAALDEDPRYIALGEGYGGGVRLLHALQGIVVAHADSGRLTANLPVLVGTFGAAFLAKTLYYPQLGLPELQSGTALVKTVSGNLGLDVVINIWGEFHPLRRGF